MSLKINDAYQLHIRILPNVDTCMMSMLYNTQILLCHMVDHFVVFFSKRFHDMIVSWQNGCSTEKALPTTTTVTRREEVPASYGKRMFLCMSPRF